MMWLEVLMRDRRQSSRIQTQRGKEGHTEVHTETLFLLHQQSKATRGRERKRERESRVCVGRSWVAIHTYHMT